MTKSDFYKHLIEIQVKHGQGLSGIVKITGKDSNNMTRWLDEFIEEGLVEACDTGGSLGHPETDVFYMPTSGYNVWEDNFGYKDQYSRFKGPNLHFVRIYLGSFEDDKLLSIYKSMLKDSECLKKYQKWLAHNQEQLEIMVNLDPIYKGKDFEFSEKEIKFITSREWFEEDKTIKECLKESIQAASDSSKKVDILKELRRLYKMKDGDESVDYLRNEEEIKENEEFISIRKKLHFWLESKDENLRIKEAFEFEFK